MFRQKHLRETKCGLMAICQIYKKLICSPEKTKEINIYYYDDNTCAIEWWCVELLLLMYKPIWSLVFKNHERSTNMRPQFRKGEEIKKSILNKANKYAS